MDKVNVDIREGNRRIINIEESPKLNRQIMELEEQIYKEVGRKFDLNSENQIADVLFSDLRMPKGRGWPQFVNIHTAAKSILYYKQLVCAREIIRATRCLRRAADAKKPHRKQKNK